MTDQIGGNRGDVSMQVGLEPATSGLVPVRAELAAAANAGEHSGATLVEPSFPWIVL